MTKRRLGLDNEMMVLDSTGAGLCSRNAATMTRRDVYVYRLRRRRNSSDPSSFNSAQGISAQSRVCCQAHTDIPKCEIQCGVGLWLHISR